MLGYYCLVFSIDASDSSKLVKFVNDASKRFVNCIVKPMVIDTVPHLVLLFAAKHHTLAQHSHGSARVL